jgi:hypothetical protein
MSGVENPDLFYKKFVEEKRAWYKTIGSIYCPILQVKVVFNSKGFRHLLYNGLGKARSKEERINRLQLLPLVIPVVRSANNIKKHKEVYLTILKIKMEYWMLQEIVGRQKSNIIVILRKIGDGNVIFYSVWKKRDKI